jgi:hypothetical protein
MALDSDSAYKVQGLKIDLVQRMGPLFFRSLAEAPEGAAGAGGGAGLFAAVDHEDNRRNCCCEHDSEDYCRRQIHDQICIFTAKLRFFFNTQHRPASRKCMRKKTAECP